MHLIELIDEKIEKIQSKTILLNSLPKNFEIYIRLIVDGITDMLTIWITSIASVNFGNNIGKIIGAKINIILLALDGIIISLKIYFKASAKLWKRPKGPTTFGPFLFWTNAQTLLSTHTIKAIDTKTGRSKKIIL